MKYFVFFASLFVVTFAALAAEQQGINPPADTAGFTKALLEMQQQIQANESRHQAELDALKKQVADQQAVIDSLKKTAVAGSSPPLPTGASQTVEIPLTGPGTNNAPVIPTTDESAVAGGSAAPTPLTPPATTAMGNFPTSDTSVVSEPGIGTAPITIAGGGKNYLNFSFDGMFAGAVSTARDLDRIEVGDHDPQQRGFNARNLEIALDGAVDPCFEGFANIVFKLDNENETEVEVEEAFMQTTTLPWGLQVKGGQFFTAFGRNNPQHPHVWDFADAPLVNGRLLGPDGLRGVGLQIAWVAPVPWYSQFLLAVQNGQGGTGFSFRNPGEDGVFYGRETIDRQLRGPQDLVFVPRWENSFDLSATRTLLFGVSGAFGPNDTGPHERTQVYGVDAFYKWKPANAEGGWPFLKWQTEAMVRRFEAGRGIDDAFPAAETFNDWGVYSQVVWGFHKGWTAGIRGDYLRIDDSPITDDPDRQSRWRLSAGVTYYPSEFSKIRLQYNRDWLQQTHFLDNREVDSVFLQFEFALGAHGAHKF